MGITRGEIVELYNRIKNEYKNLDELRKEKRDNVIEGLYIFDENQSVKWNKEKCEAHNLKFTIPYDEKKKEIEDLEQKLKENIKYYLDLSERDYDLVREFAYEWNESTYNMEDGIDCYLDFFNDVIRLIKEIKVKD